MPKITSRNTPETEETAFPQQKSQKIQFLFIPVTFYDGDTSFSSRNYFSQAEISYESKRVLFDQMEVSERLTEPKN